MLERSSGIASLLAGPLLALLAASAEASAGAHDLHVAVWGLDDTLLDDAQVSFACDDGAAKGSLLPDGCYLVTNEDRKGTLCVEHEELGRVEFEVRLPDQVPVEVDVVFLAEDLADLILDQPEQKVRGRDGFLGEFPPGNDLCQNAYELVPPTTINGSSANATVDSEPSEFCGTSINGPGVWFRVTGTGTTMEASTCVGTTTFDTKLSVFCGSCEEPVCIAGNDDFTCTTDPFFSRVEWCTELGQEYLILVHSFGGASGNYGLTLDATSVPCEPRVICEPIGACCLPTDECADALTFDECSALGGVFQGPDTQCAGEFVEYVAGISQFLLVDISASGTPIVLGDDDFEELPIGFPFIFFGEAIQAVNVSSNGYLTTTTDATDFSPDPCLDADAPNSAIFGLWHDFNPGAGGEVDYQLFGAAPARTWIVQWTDVLEYENEEDTATFQIALFEATGEIYVCYMDLEGIPDGPGDVTVGVEDETGLAGACIDQGDVVEEICYIFTPQFVGPIRCDCTLLDFQTEDDELTPLVNGQDISTPPELGEHLAIHGTGAGNLGTAVFDSDPAGPNASSSDPDLLVNLGNVLILQSTDDPAQSVPGIFDFPNDSSGGGVITIEFLSPAEVRSIDLIDLDFGHDDAVQILIYDVNGRTRGYWVPDGWTTDVASEGPPGFGTLDLTSLAPQPGAHGQVAQGTSHPGFDPTAVVAIEIHMRGSGAIDNLEYCVSDDSDPE